MPRKIQRSSPSSPAPQLAITDTGAAYLAIAHLGAETTKAAAQVYSATANLVATTVQSLAECAKAYFNYLEVCERTRQVEIWSATVLADSVFRLIVDVETPAGVAAEIAIPSGERELGAVERLYRWRCSE